MLFLFDYGDNWEFRVEVIGFDEKVPKTRYPDEPAGETAPRLPAVACI